MEVEPISGKVLSVQCRFIGGKGQSQGSPVQVVGEGSYQPGRPSGKKLPHQKDSFLGSIQM